MALKKTGITPISFTGDGYSYQAGTDLLNEKFRIQAASLSEPMLSHALPTGAEIWRVSPVLRGESLNSTSASRSEGRIFQSQLGGFTVQVSPAGKILSCSQDASPETQCQSMGGTYSATAIPACRLALPFCANDLIPSYLPNGNIVCKDLRQLIAETCPPDHVLVSSGGGSADCVSRFQVEEGQCYEVTCTSNANRTKTFTGITDADGFIRTVAPSTLSVWLTRIDKNGQASENYNCVPDQNVAYTGPGLELGNAACQRLRPGTAGINPISATFTRGYSFAQNGCSTQRCGASKSDFVLEPNGTYHWAEAVYDSAGVGTARVKIRAVPNGPYSPSLASYDFNLVKDQCRTDVFSVYNHQTFRHDLTTYISCYSGNTLTVRVGAEELVVDVTPVEPVIPKPR